MILGVVLIGMLIAVLNKGKLFKTNTQKSPKTSVGPWTAMEHSKSAMLKEK